MEVTLTDTTSVSNGELLRRQEELENAGMAAGAERFKRRLEEAIASGRSSEAGAARKLLREGLAPVERGITEFLQLAQITPGRRHVSLPWIDAIGPEVGAYMTLRAVLDALGTGRAPLRSVAFAIAGLVVDELRYRKFKEEAPALMRYRLNSFTTNNYKHRKRSLDDAMAWAEVNVDEFDLDDRDRMLLGLKLLDILVTTTQLVRIETLGTPAFERKVGEAPKRHSWVVAEPETLAWMEKRNSRMELAHPVNMPMVIPPAPWGKGVRGGYRFAQRGRYQLARGVSKKHESLLGSLDMTVLYRALNAMQDTAWRINIKVLGLMAQMADRKMLPGTQDEPLPRKPENIAEDTEARRVWRRSAAGVKDRNVRAQARRLTVSRMLSVAGSLTETPIYFPHSLDFRGRVYPLTNYLQPQGDDMQKALLSFDTAVPLGESGYRALTLHLASCLDETPNGVKMSTLTLDERAAWIENHARQIEAAADEPLSNLWWLDADSPFCFLAAAWEWTAARRHSAGRSAYPCALPVSMDGTCNGIQHFSALFRDPVGGAAVNLVPAERPSDLYALEAGDVLKHVEHDLSRPALEMGPDEMRWPALWLSSGLINRKLAKRPTMTFGYGSRRFGFAQQLQEYLQGHDEWAKIKAHFTYVNDEGREVIGVVAACNYLAGVIWDCLRHRVVAAFNGMEWMREAVGVLSKRGLPIEWSVPGTGFIVRQEYWEVKAHRVKTTLAGQIVRPSVYSNTNITRVEKQQNALPPNFIHSLDACVLMHTVSAALAEGVTHFGMVHDSFGCLPAHAETFARVTREQFVAYYTTHDPIGSLHEEFRRAAESIPSSEEWEGGAEVPSPPAPGTLDIEGVLRSAYFFS